MLLIRGHAGGTALTGTLYEPGDSPPTFEGAPDDGAPFVWVCDAFYEVESGGQVQRIDGRERNVAFEAPTTLGFESREAALEAAEDHVRTQFARLGLDGDAVEIEMIDDPGESAAGREDDRSDGSGRGSDDPGR